MTSSFYKKQFSRIVQKVQGFFVLMRQHPMFSFLFFFGIIVSLFGISQIVTAEGVIAGGANAVRDELLYAFINVNLVGAKIFITASIFFLRFFINLASYNNYIDTNTVKLGWLMIRDIANMFFVVILLVIAFMTILGAGGYEWKKSMGKLIFAAIFINFSNLICALIIDAAHVFTMTFLSAIINTAGGNLIQMFSFDKVFQMVNDGSLTNGDMTFELLGASALIILLTGLIAYTMGAFLLVMVARVVVLWALIILSPLAFLMQATPRGEKYASEWWSKFLNHVLVAPIMVFFLWLTFATLGNGNVYEQDIAPGMANGTPKLSESSEPGIENKLSISRVSTWENIANIIIAIAFMRVAIMMVQRLDVEGGKFTQGAWGFATKIAAVASGITLARAGAERGGQFAKEKGKQLGVGLAKYTYAKSGVKGGIEQAKYRINKLKYDSIKSRAENAEEYARAPIEGAGLIGGAKGLLKRGWGKVINPIQRVEKDVTNWTKASEKAKEHMEANLKASSLKSAYAVGMESKRAATQEGVGETKKAERIKQNELELHLINENPEASLEQIRAMVEKSQINAKMESYRTQGKYDKKTNKWEKYSEEELKTLEDDEREKMADEKKKTGKGVVLASDRLGFDFVKEFAKDVVGKENTIVDTKLRAEQHGRTLDALDGVTQRADKEALTMAGIQTGKKMDSTISDQRMAVLREDLDRSFGGVSAETKAKLYEDRKMYARAAEERRRWSNSELNKNSESAKGLEYPQRITQLVDLKREIERLGDGEEKNIKVRELSSLLDVMSQDPKELREGLETAYENQIKVTDENSQDMIKGIITGTGKVMSKEVGGEMIKMLDTSLVRSAKADDALVKALGSSGRVDDTRGTQLAQTFMGRLNSNAMGMALSKGDFGFIGTINKDDSEKSRDKESGRIIPRFSLDQKVSEKQKKGKLDFAHENMTSRNIQHIQGLYSSDSNGKVVLNSENVKALLSSFGSGIQARSGVGQMLLTSIRKMKDTDPLKKELGTQMQEILADLRKDVYNKEDKNIKDAIKALDEMFEQAFHIEKP